MVSPGFVFTVLYVTGVLSGVTLCLFGNCLHKKRVSDSMIWIFVPLGVAIYLCGTLGVQRLKDLQFEAFTAGVRSEKASHSEQRAERSGPN